jgi:hypothetical protein
MWAPATARRICCGTEPYRHRIGAHLRLIPIPASGGECDDEACAAIDGRPSRRLQPGRQILLADPADNLIELFQQTAHRSASTPTT